jgi:exosortase
MGNNTLPAPSSQVARHFWIFAICIPALLVFWPSLKTAFSLALNDDRYLQIGLAPLVCSFLIFWQRTEIFSEACYSLRTGIPLLSLAILLGIVIVYRSPRSGSAGLVFALGAIVLIWLAAFFLCYGVQSLRAALYPLCCLFLMIPFPPVWMDRVAACLQYGSAAVSYAILRVSGIPVLRHELRFSLPGLDFEVAPECSGIHSSLALIMVAIIAGYIYLRSGWARSALILLTVPIALFKNAVRIVVIAVLGAYVNRIFVDGPFHHRYGGLVFSVMGAVLFVLVLAGLQGVERRLSLPRPAPQEPVRSERGDKILAKDRRNSALG